MSLQTSDRRHELDWLRVMAIMVVFLYHSTRFFNLEDWHVKNVNTQDHVLRIQPRQTPHRIDQIWLSRSQQHISNTNEPVK